MASSGKQGRFRVRFSDGRSYWRVKTILAFEAKKNGRTTGQTICDLVASVADIESYPEEVRARLDELDQLSEVMAVEKALEMSREDE